MTEPTSQLDDDQVKDSQPMSPQDLQLALAEDCVKSSGAVLSEDTAKIRKIRRLVKSILQGNSTYRILDIGSADGSVLYPFINDPAVTEIVAVDQNPAFLDVAKSRGFKTVCTNIDCKRLPFEDRTFDIVYAGDVIEHMVDTDWFLSECNRVLRQNGILILSIPNIRTPASIAAMIFCDYPPMGSARYRSGHFRDFTLSTAKMAIKNNGFNVVHHEGAYIYIPGLGEAFTWLASYLTSWSLQMIIEARKVSDSSYTRKNVTAGNIFDRSGSA